MFAGHSQDEVRTQQHKHIRYGHKDFLPLLGAKIMRSRLYFAFRVAEVIFRNDLRILQAELNNLILGEVFAINAIVSILLPATDFPENPLYAQAAYQNGLSRGLAFRYANGTHFLFGAHLQGEPSSRWIGQ